MNRLVFIRLSFLLFAVIAVGKGFSQVQTAVYSKEVFSADDIVGVWKNSDNAVHVKIEKIGSHYFGKMVWLEKPLEPDGTPKLDKNNPDPDLRKVPFIGLRVMKDMKYRGDGIWHGGTIYDPEKGKTYGCKITLIDKNQANIRGFIGLSLLGKTEKFTRLQN